MRTISGDSDDDQQRSVVDQIIRIFTNINIVRNKINGLECGLNHDIYSSLCLHIVTNLIPKFLIKNMVNGGITCVLYFCQIKLPVQ